jgi:hypothetical protein
MVEFQIEFKKGALTIRLTGESTTEIISSLDDALKLFEKADKKLERISVSKKRESEDLKELEGIPTLQSPESIRDAVSQLMASDWGKTPRTMTEIMNAMEVNAIYYPKSSVSSSLTKMTKSGLLRRIRSPQGYKYVSGVKKKTQ